MRVSRPGRKKRVVTIGQSGGQRVKGGQMKTVLADGEAEDDCEASLLPRAVETDPHGDGKDGSGSPSSRRGQKGALARELGLADGIAFVVGGIIGSGIFATPGIVLLHTHSVGLSTVCWLAGMVIAISGALCYIELGLLLPQTGGEFLYIMEAYSFRRKNPSLEFLGSLLAFLFTWTAVSILRPVGLSIITLTCAKYLVQTFYGSSSAPTIMVKLFSLFIIVIITVILCRSTRLTAKLQTFLSTLKVLSCVFLILLGIYSLLKAGHFPADSRSPFAGSHFSRAEDLGSLALGLYAVLWTYDGWNNLNYAVEEQKNVEQNLPRALLIGLPIVAMCYVLVNLSFFTSLSYQQINSSVTVALPFGEAVLGGAGLVVIPLIVAVATFGAGLSSLYTSSRLIFAASRDGQLPEVLCGIHKSWHTPLTAILLSSVISCVLVVMGDIENLIGGFSAAMWLFYGMVFLGLVIMRSSHREQRRPFKVWLCVPVFMLAVSVCLILLPIVTQPWPSIYAFSLILCGAPVYLLLVMEKPLKVRPLLLDRLSGDFSRYINTIFKMESSRDSSP